jgi:uncharacterized protein
MNERFVNINTDNGSLSAILHPASATTGVLVIVGGPQYRVGSHRQFVKLSRALAADGIPSLRLDSSGMGDSRGDKAAFYQQADDIQQAITAFFAACPQLKQVVLWGLCDAASAILIQLHQPDPRIRAIVLLNPWVRQQQSHAQTMLKHYYLKRLLSRQFWQKVLGGSFAVRSSLSALWQTLRASKTKASLAAAQPQLTEHNYVAAMLSGWQQFHGKVLLITSGNDLTAQEFLDLCGSDADWQTQKNAASQRHIAGANHTFASKAWREEVELATIQFVRDISTEC